MKNNALTEVKRRELENEARRLFYRVYVDGKNNEKKMFDAVYAEMKRRNMQIVETMLISRK